MELFWRATRHFPGRALRCAVGHSAGSLHAAACTRLVHADCRLDALTSVRCRCALWPPCGAQLCLARAAVRQLLWETIVNTFGHAWLRVWFVPAPSWFVRTSTRGARERREATAYWLR